MELAWVCRGCFCKAYPYRALGMTSRYKEKCEVCRKEDICGMYPRNELKDFRERLRNGKAGV